jgi:hypothetical protein
VEPSLKRHKENFGRAPELYSSDRGFFSETNVKSCKQKGVKVECIPQLGGKKTAKRKAYEKSLLSRALFHSVPKSMIAMICAPLSSHAKSVKSLSPSQSLSQDTGFATETSREESKEEET